MSSSSEAGAGARAIAVECGEGARADAARIHLAPGAFLVLALDAAPGCHELVVTLGGPTALRLELVTSAGAIPLPLAREGAVSRAVFRLAEPVAQARLAPVEGEELSPVRASLRCVPPWRSLLPDWPLGPVALPPCPAAEGDGPCRFDPPLRPPGWSRRIRVEAAEAAEIEGTRIAVGPGGTIGLTLDPPLAPGRYRLTGRFLDRNGRPARVEPRVLVPGTARDPVAGPPLLPARGGRLDGTIALERPAAGLLLRPRTGPGPVDVRDLAVVPEGRFGAFVRQTRARWHRRRRAPGGTIALAPARPAGGSGALAATVVTATRDAPGHLSRFLATVATGPALPFELVLVDNGTRDGEALTLLREAARRPRVSVIADPRPFNFAALANTGARAARGEILVFANNDLEFPDGDWLAPLVAAARDRRVGVAGARLLYPDGRIQHDGLALAGETRVAHLARFARPGRAPAPPAGAARTAEAVTGALMAVKADLFAALGGFDAERFGVLYNDVDLCLRAARAGRATVIVGGPHVIHHESATIGPPRRDALLARGGPLWRLGRAEEARRFAEAWAAGEAGEPPPWPGRKPGVSQRGSSEDPPAGAGA